MDINPFSFISESVEKMNDKDISIEVWQHKLSKHLFQVDKENKLYRKISKSNKKQETFQKCPFIHIFHKNELK